MRLSLNWLKEYVDIQMSAHELEGLLTMIGLEVEEIEPVGHGLDDLLVGKILTIDPHPKAERLSLCRVDTGQDSVQVVCGATNLEVGALVPLALPGTRLPDGTIIKETKIREVSSTGMLLAEDEMGLTDDHSGIMILPAGVRPGSSLPTVLPLSDWAFDVSITPNRADCASVMGIAREVAAATGKRLKWPQIEMQETGPAIEDLSSVTILDPAGCPRYAAGIIQDVRLTPSPFWMRYRLHVSGVRCISNVVDVTNYVMLEMGQPLHAFDYNRLRENRIVVRRAEADERFTTLDGETRGLHTETLMICDGERPVALAGIMGGLNSEIFSGTQDVLLESAFFDPVTIRRASKRLGLSTEASYRFEREIDIEGVPTALTRAMSLIHRLAGGTVAKGFIDAYPKIYKPRRIVLRVDKTNGFLGTAIPKDAMGAHLRSLEMDVREAGENELMVTPPSFRVDISREVDLMEEVARIAGYDKIPVTYPSISPSEKGVSGSLRLGDQVKEIMVGLGFSEVITYGFISPDSPDILGADKGSPLRSLVRLINPLTVDQSVMRTSLIPGLMMTVKTNFLHGQKDLKVFEWGKVFIQKEGEELPLEKPFLAAVITGVPHPKTWYNEARPSDFYDIKGAVESLLRGLGIEGFVFHKESGLHGYDSAVSSSIRLNDIVLGWVGRVSKGSMEAYGLESDDAYVFELDGEALLEHLAGVKKFRPFTKYPAVYRDISVIVGRHTESAKLTEIIKQTGGEWVESVHIFDLYEGKKMDPSEKALAFNICFRSKERTLGGEEVNRLYESIIDRIRQETGGRLREG